MAAGHEVIGMSSSEKTELEACAKQVPGSSPGRGATILVFRDSRH